MQRQFPRFDASPADATEHQGIVGHGVTQTGGIEPLALPERNALAANRINIRHGFAHLLDRIDVMAPGTHQGSLVHANIGARRLAALDRKLERHDVLHAIHALRNLHHFAAVNMTPKRPAGSVRPTGQRMKEIAQRCDEPLRT